MNSCTSLGARLLTVLVLALALASAVACTQSPEAKKQKSVERAEAYLKEGKANEAIIELRNALQIDKDFVPALRALARAYAAKAWYADAARELGRAQTLMPDSLEIAGELGRMQIEIALWKEVAQQSDRILAKAPRNSLGLSLRAVARLAEDKAEEALALADQAAKGEGGIPADFVPVRAEALVRLGRRAEAEQAFRAALVANPKDRRSLGGLGALEMGAKRYAEAKQLYQEAVTLAPQDPRMRLGLAAATAALGDVRGAIKVLEAVDVRARNVGVLMSLGTYYMRDGRAQDTIALIAPVVARAPTLTGARLLLASAYLTTNAPGPAIGHLEELRKVAPGNATVEFRLAQAYSRVGRPKDALTLLDAHAKQLDKAPGFHLERGRALILLGRLEDAYQEGRIAQALAPQSAQPLLMLGQLRAQQGKSKEAHELFTKAAEFEQGSVSARLALGRLRASERDAEGALAEFDTAVRADPKSVAAARAKVLALVQQKRTKEAVQFLESAVKAEPTVAGLHGLLGALYLEDKQLEKARATYQKELEIAPKSAEARVGLAQVALRLQKDEEAMSHLQAAVKDTPQQLAAVLLLASVAEKLGRYDQGIGPLETAVKANPDQVGLALALDTLRHGAGQNDEVIADTTELLRRFPALSTARLLRAQAYLAKRDGAAALVDLTEIARAAPKDPTPQIFLGRAYAAMGRVAEAQAAYRAALKLDPTLEVPKQELALLSGEKLDPEALKKRVESYRAALLRDPRNIAQREGLARALLAGGQDKEAEAELKTLLDQAPGHTGGNLLMAQLRFAQGRPDDAASHLRAVLRTNPNSLEANIILARYLYRQNRREEARPLLETALRINPALAEVKFELGILYSELGRYADAMRLVEELEKAHPKSWTPLTLKGQIHLAQGNVKAAAEAFSGAIALGGNVSAAHRGLAQALEAQGLPDRAIEQYRKALALQGNDVVALNNLAWLLLESKKQPDEALALATKAFQMAPRSAEIADTLGWIHYRRGAYVDAEKTLAQAEQNAPGNAQIKYHLGRTYAKLGKKDDAVSSLRRAAQIDPKLAQAEKIADLIKELGG